MRPWIAWNLCIARGETTVHFGFALASLPFEKYNNVLIMVALGGGCCTFSRLQC